MSTSIGKLKSLFMSHLNYDKVFSANQMEMNVRYLNPETGAVMGYLEVKSTRDFLWMYWRPTMMMQIDLFPTVLVDIVGDPMIFERIEDGGPGWQAAPVVSDPDVENEAVKKVLLGMKYMMRFHDAHSAGRRSDEEKADRPEEERAERPRGDGVDRGDEKRGVTTTRLPTTSTFAH